jgi:hypothetical protein
VNWWIDMELFAQGRGVVKIFRAAENGEPLAYWAAGFLVLYIVTVLVFLGLNWATGRPVHRKRELIGYTIAFGISLGYCAYMIFGIAARLMA